MLHKLDVMFLIETWLDENNKVAALIERPLTLTFWMQLQEEEEVELPIFGTYNSFE